MKNCGYLLTILPCLLFSAYSYSYEVETHRSLSEKAFLASTLGMDSSSLSNMGINAAQEFPDSKGFPSTPGQLMMRGAIFEDELSFYRPINHFFNPLNGSALTGVPGNYPSPDWALEDAATIGLQDFSYRDARDYFYKALTLPDKTERDKNAGLTFQTIGMVIHHIQDMAQPQHVRNDAHLDLGLGSYFPGIENPSVYELFTDRPDVRSTLPFTGYAPVYSGADTTTFTTPRYFWTKTTGAGLAQFTNSNFVSAGTNFDNPGMFNFPLFDPAKRVDIDIQQLCANANPPCPNPALTGIMTFYGNTVEDRYTGQTTLNPLASTESLFSADLETKLSQKAFTLNRFNFSVAQGFLIPRAVGYSAGLINYFFRGQIALVGSPDHPGFYTIKNLSSEDMNGTFKLFYDDAGDVRYEVPGAVWNLQIPANGESGLITLPLPVSASLPQPKGADKLVLAFSGSMGQETSGAVAGKIVSCAGSGVAGGQANIAPIAPLDLIAKHKAGDIFSPEVIGGEVVLARRQLIDYSKYGVNATAWARVWHLKLMDGSFSWVYGNLVAGGDLTLIGVNKFSTSDDAIRAGYNTLKAWGMSQGRNYLYEVARTSAYDWEVNAYFTFTDRPVAEYEALAGCSSGVLTFASESEAALWLLTNLK